MAGAPALLELPTDHPRPAVLSYRGAKEKLSLPRTLADKLHDLSRVEGATLYMTGKVTAFLEVVTQTLQNGVSINTAPAHAGTVDVATAVTGASGNPPCAVGCRPPQSR